MNAQRVGMRVIGILAMSAMVSAGQPETLESGSWQAPNGLTFPYRWHAPEEPAPGKRYPLVLFLHGAGERGDDNQAQLKHGVGAILREAAKLNEPFFLLVPQCPKDTHWAPFDRAKDEYKTDEKSNERLAAVWSLVEKFRKDQPVDPARVYVTGISMGGFGTWALLARESKEIAAAVPICGGGDVRYARRFKDVPVWAFHGEADSIISVEYTRAIIGALEKAGGKPKSTYYPGVDHDSWTMTYDNPEVLRWLFAQKKPG